MTCHKKHFKRFDPYLGIVQFYVYNVKMTFEIHILNWHKLNKTLIHTESCFLRYKDSAVSNLFILHP